MTSELYFVDRKGDVQNSTYQRLHKYDVPAYRRSGYGNILGLDSHFKIDRALSVEDKLYLTDTRRAYASDQQRALLKRPGRHQAPEMRLRLPKDLHVPDSSSDFISLRSNGHLARKPLTKPEVEPFDEIRSLYGTTSQLRSPVDKDLAYASSDSESDNYDLDVHIRQRNVELSRKAKLEPTNLHAWLELVAHQEYLVCPTVLGTGSSQMSDTERRTLADLRLHILDKASKSIPLNDKPARETLYHALFEEATFIWELDKYLTRLHEAIQELPGSLILWTMYLNAAQSRAKGFRFEYGKAFFLQSLKSMKSAWSVSTGTSVGEAEDMQLYIVLRYTAYLRESGHDELAIAVWQALLEYHLFRPQRSVIDDSTTLLNLFETFWESEVPRFGEPGSQGWWNYSSESALPHEDQAEAHEQILSTSQPFSSFATLERNASDTFRFPGRSIDEEDTEDPFHIVFFSDIKDVLEATPYQLSRNGLIDAFLCFLGLAVRPSSTRTRDHDLRVQSWRIDAFLTTGLLTEMNLAKSGDSLWTPLIERFEASTSTLFASRRFDLPITTPANLVSFAHLSLENLVQNNPLDEVLAEYYLAFEYHFRPKDASKSAKAILKRLPSSLRLYNACAVIESNLGRDEKANKIWTGASKLIESLPVEAQQEAVMLRHSWAWELMQKGDLKAALLRLVFFDRSTEQDLATPISSSATLRVKRMLKAGFEHACSQHHDHIAVQNADCLALLEYLSNTDALSAGVTVIDQHCALLLDFQGTYTNKLLLELLHQAKAHLIEYHIQQKRAYKPAFVRSQLEASIRLFPSNTMFLSLYKENEARFRIDDRVRTVLRDANLVDPKFLSVRVSFDVDQEIARFASQSSGSTAESVRATFAKALLATGSPLRHCRTLWNRWVRFEKEVVRRYMMIDPGLDTRGGKLAARKWKEVFLGGLHSLPWAKDWILDGLQWFDGNKSFCWSTGDLKALYNVLHERELRVRVEGLEDLLDDISEGLK